MSILELCNAQTWIELISSYWLCVGTRNGIFAQQMCWFLYVHNWFSESNHSLINLVEVDHDLNPGKRRYILNG
jgi:hypothetical protein